MSTLPPPPEPEIPVTEPSPDLPPARRFSARMRWISWVVAALVIAIALFLVLRPSDGTSAGGGRSGGRRGGPATTVGTAKASLRDVPIILESLGTVTPAATVTVRPQVSGI